MGEIHTFLDDMRKNQFQSIQEVPSLLHFTMTSPMSTNADAAIICPTVASMVFPVEVTHPSPSILLSKRVGDW